MNRITYSVKIALLTALVSLLFGISIYGAQFRYTAAWQGEISTLTSGSSFKYPLQEAFGIALSNQFSPDWDVTLSFMYYDLYDDSTASSSFLFKKNTGKAGSRFKANRLGVDIQRYFFGPERVINIKAGLGGGLLIWKMVDPDEGTVFKKTGSKNETIDYSATEVFVSGIIRFEIPLSGRWSVVLGGHADYLTGAGAEFSDDVNSNRDRWLLGSALALSVGFGSTQSNSGKWPSEKVWSDTPDNRKSEPVTPTDGDGDGVDDADDDCLDTPFGVEVDRSGCPVDGDQDGVANGLDDCPDTDVRARGKVDIYGCPVDSDFDGIPDYLDNCPTNQIGAIVDELGCPLDSDADGVADGLDDCPGTLYGIEVDKYGCIDLSMFAKPMVLAIDYPPGSFEVDPNNQDRLRDLARVLTIVPDIRLEINGYTDDIGKAPDNQKLSEKRANRVRDYLLALGIEKERMKVFGRGETNFITSNETSEGRARNRRIEIVFYK